MLARSAVNEVELLDTQFENGCEDLTKNKIDMQTKTKKCTFCKQEKILEEFYRHEIRNKIYLQSRCKECYKKTWNEYSNNKRKKLSLEKRQKKLLRTCKICTCCKQQKLLNDFYEQKIGKKIYLKSECKECFTKRAEKFRKEHLEQYRETKKRYVLKNPKRWKKYAKDYQKVNRQRMSKNVMIGYFKEKLKNEFNYIFVIPRRARTLQELVELHEKIKSLYINLKKKTKNAT